MPWGLNLTLPQVRLTMTKYIIDKKVMGRLSLLIWCAGLIFFAGLSFQYLLGLIDFIFSYLSSLVSDSRPSHAASSDAKSAWSILFPVFVFCLLLQLAVLAFPRFLTGSREAIAYYHKHEEDYIEALSSRIDLAKQVTDLSESLDSLKRKIAKCHQAQSELTLDVKMLAEIVDHTRESLPVGFRKDPKLRGKGDF